MRFTLITACALVALNMFLAAAPAHGADVQTQTTWAIDPVHSSIVWSIGHNGGIGLVYGRFNGFNGTVVTDAAHPEKSSVEVTVDAASVDSAVTARDEHLRSADFFDVGNFPVLSFSSTAVAPVAGTDNAFDVTGELTLLGSVKTITVRMLHTGTATDMHGVQVAGFTGALKIMRSDFGMDFGLPGIGDEVNIMLSFECQAVVPTAPAA